MKITIKHHNTKRSIEVPDEIKFDEFMDELKGLLSNVWTNNLVKEYWEE